MVLLEKGRGEWRMNAEEFIKAVTEISKLKTTLRHCYTMPERKESVADHSWRTAMMALFLRKEEPFLSVDMDRVIRMILIHDIGEIFTGDIPTFEKTQSDAKTEEELYLDWIGNLPASQRTEWFSLVQEMEKMETAEARIYKALDKMEALISHNESDLSTWLPLEYDLQFTYGQKEAQCNPMLSEVRRLIDIWSTQKIREE